MRRRFVRRIDKIVEKTDDNGEYGGSERLGGEMTAVSEEERRGGERERGEGGGASGMVRATLFIHFDLNYHW